MSGEKKRLEQFLLQRRASNIVREPTLTQLTRFQPENIDRIRLIAAQKEAGKVPVSEKLVKQQKKKKKKARRSKQLRGEVGRSIREQKRFERGERRDRPEDEPRVVGEVRNTGLSYDPDIERRRLDIQQQQIADANLRALAERRDAGIRQERELAVRRGELAAARAERRLERERIAALPPPPAPGPIVIPPAPAPVVNIAAPPPAQVDIGGIAPVINIPQLPARADADPIPEITRLGAEIRADYNAFGQEQEQRNRDVLRQIREQTDAQQAESAALRQGQEQTSQTIREAVARQDALNQEFQERLGLGEASISEARDAVIGELRATEGRLRGAAEDLNRPVNYDDVILRAVDEAVREGLEEGTPEILRRRVPIEEVDSPTPIEETIPIPEPEGIEGVIEGGGLFDLPNVVVERPRNIGPDESLRLSPEDPRDRPGEVVEGINPETGRAFRIQTRPGTAGPTGRRAGGGGPLRGTSAAEEAESEFRPGTPTPREEELARIQQEEEQRERLQLDPVDPINVAETLRLSRLALEEAEPILQAEEAEEEQQRLRLVDSQDFLAGFERPQQQGSSQGSAVESPVSTPSVARPNTPELTPATREEEELLAQQAEIIEERERRVSEEPLQPVARGIAQFGGASQRAPERVIEDAGIQEIPEQDPSLRELRPLDPDVLFEAVEEAEQVGSVQDQRAQRIRDSRTLFQDSFPELAGEVRTGPRGRRGQRGGLGYRIINNTDRKLKKIEPSDVVNVIGVEEGERGEGRYRFDTQTAAGTRVGLDQLQPLIDDGSFIFERGHRHELGGHFDENPYGPPVLQDPSLEEEPGLLQQGAEAVAGVAGAGARLAGGVAQGVGEGLYEQLPAAGDVGAAIGRGAVAGVAGAGRLAAGAAGALGEAVFGGEEEEAEP